MRSIAANAFTLLIVLGFAIVGAAAWSERAFHAPGPSTEARVVVVPRGASLDELARRLESDGVIASATLFRLGARYARQANALRFGEYEMPAAASMADVLALLVSGRSIQHAITVPEGLTSWEIVRLLEASDLLTGEIAAVPPEGSLAPETYNVQRGDSREGVITRMKELQERTLAEAWASRKEGLSLRTPEEALALASIIEKETGLVEERTRVSAVFHNRLARGMRLQSDPTIVYGITEGKGPLDRPLTRADINRRTRWNTYAIDGLPPTPIANPGRASILAALQPIESEELYFVADGTGGHVFARTLAEHNRNVQVWREIERSRTAP